MSNIDQVIASIPKQVVVHPIVLLSIVDHYNRLAKGSKKDKWVVGTLLGEYEKGILNITNCFAVPFEEDEEIQYLDHIYHEEMYLMFRKINSKEKIVGWYSSGPTIWKSDIEINEKLRNYNSNPVFVVAKVQENDQLSIPTEAYCSIQEVNEEGQLVRNFIHIPSSIEATEAEQIGVEHLLRDIKNVSVGDLSMQVSDKIRGLKALGQKIDEMRLYVEDVLKGSLPMNSDIVHNLQEIFNLLPNLSYEEIIKSFNVKTNDYMHMTYVCSLIWSIISLHNLINNKIVYNNEIEKEFKNKDAAKNAANGKAKEEGTTAGAGDDKPKEGS
jgi:26S proteasome regulatory subunit N8